MAKRAYVWDGSSWISIAQENMAFPDQTGNSGKYLFTNGTNVSWNTIDFSAYATLSNPNFSGIIKLDSVIEKMTVSATAATGTINFNVLDNKSILFYTLNSTANWTLNIRGNSSTTLDSIVSNQESITIGFLATNGSTPYYQNAFQIDGNLITPKWQGAAAPSSGNANSIDAYTFTIIKTSSSTFTVLGARTQFG